MRVEIRRFKTIAAVGTAICALILVVLAGESKAQNVVVGEIQLAGATDVAKTSGVWVDGQYVGYVHELKGSRRILLLPGEHEVVVRQSAYKDFTQRVLVEPGRKKIVQVTMERDSRVPMPGVTSEVDLSVMPKRAAVFLDDGFVGHVREFGGHGRGMLLSPGKHRIKIALPGYQTFETEINLLAGQKFQIKTDLVKGSVIESGPLVSQR